MSTYFEKTQRNIFEGDLAEKESIILLREMNSGLIQGFTTLMRLEVNVDSQDIVAFYSGDTIVAKEYWGETVLSRLWGQIVFTEADLIAVERPSAQVFWFLISSGYKTYRFLPVFFREFFPCPSLSTPQHIQRILDVLGKTRFGSEYDAASGIVRLQQAAPLRHGVADITEQRLNDPMVAFFNRKNPGHTRGDELACIARISRANVTRAGERMLAAQNSLK
ncbi:MAG: hypothetical protein ABSG62_14360 [Terracidiphilus sp.]|jgi:hypothetical protein